MDTWLQDAAAKAMLRDGLITRAELDAAGAKPKRIAAMIDVGWLRRERHGVYAFAGSPRSWRQNIRAAQCAAGDGALISHSCAATVWQFRHLPYLMPEISVPRRRRVEVEGVHVHHVGEFPTDDCTVRDGLPVTSFERTLVDCTTVLSQYQLLANLDDGLRRNVASLRTLRECVDRLRSGPGRRLSVMTWVLEQRPLGYKPGGSRAERRVLDVLVRGGLPAPTQQHRVDVNGKTYYLDYAYPKHKVFIEYYGLAWHGTPSAVAYDSARLSDLSTLRWLPLIFTDASSDRVIVERTAAVLAGS